jgi:hypothetical protein
MVGVHGTDQVVVRHVVVPLHMDRTHWHLLLILGMSCNFEVTIKHNSQLGGKHLTDFFVGL